MDDDRLKTESDDVTANASLVDLRLRRLDAELFALIVAAGGLEIRPKVDAVFARLDEEFVIYDVDYSFDVRDSSDMEIVSVAVGLTLVFEIGRKMTDEELRSFGALGVFSIAHPYVRELFHSTTSRMGLPPLVLEIMPPRPSGYVEDHSDLEVEN